MLLTGGGRLSSCPEEPGISSVGSIRAADAGGSCRLDVAGEPRPGAGANLALGTPAPSSMESERQPSSPSSDEEDELSSADQSLVGLIGAEHGGEQGPRTLSMSGSPGLRGVAVAVVMRACVAPEVWHAAEPHAEDVRVELGGPVVGMVVARWWRGPSGPRMPSVMQ